MSINVDPDSLDNRKLAAIAKNPKHPLHTHAKSIIDRRRSAQQEHAEHMGEGAMKRMATNETEPKPELAPEYSQPVTDNGTGVGFTYRMDRSPIEPTDGPEPRFDANGVDANTTGALANEQDGKGHGDEVENGLRVLCVTWNLNGKIPGEDLGKLIADHAILACSSSISNICLVLSIQALLLSSVRSFPYKLLCGVSIQASF